MRCKSCNPCLNQSLGTEPHTLSSATDITHRQLLLTSPPSHHCDFCQEANAATFQTPSNSEAQTSTRHFAQAQLSLGISAQAMPAGTQMIYAAEEPQPLAKPWVDLSSVQSPMAALAKPPLLLRSCTSPDNNSCNMSSVLHSPTSVHLAQAGHQISPSASETARVCCLPPGLSVSRDSSLNFGESRCYMVSNTHTCQANPA